jgi:phospholipase/carboxylesterase
VTLEARVRDADGVPQGALVLLHGRGADEQDLFPLLDYFDPQRRLVAATPRAPLSLPPGGRHWYVVRRIGFPDPETFGAVYPAAAEWLDAFLADRALTHDRLVLGGFSQGAVMTYALSLGAGRPRPAALIALSGFVPTVAGFELDLSPPLPPVAIGHGTLDPVIDVEFGRAARDLLRGAGADVTYRESPIPHTIDPEFARELPGWIERRLRSSLSAKRTGGGGSGEPGGSPD